MLQQGILQDRAGELQHLPAPVVVQAHTHGRRGRKSDPAWAARRRLLLRPRATDRGAVTKMWNDLVDGDATGQVLAAWVAKEQLRALLATAQTGGQRHDVAHRLHRFNSWCAQSGLPELERLAGTVQAGWPEVLGFLQTGVTNAGTVPIADRQPDGPGDAGRHRRSRPSSRGRTAAAAPTVTAACVPVRRAGEQSVGVLSGMIGS